MITGLKDHLDEGVIESTQQKLAYYRNMEEAVEKQVQEVSTSLLRSSSKWQNKHFNSKTNTFTPPHSYRPCVKD